MLYKEHLNYIGVFDKLSLSRLIMICDIFTVNHLQSIIGGTLVMSVLGYLQYTGVIWLLVGTHMFVQMN